MNPFEFSIPQNIIVGAGTLAKLPECAKKMGGTHAMILSGPTLKKMGVVDKAADSLKAAGIAADIFTDIEANPSVTTVEKATESYLASGADFLVALGGGSPMDCAKAACARVVRPNKTIPQMRGQLKVMHKLPPFFAVPTTAGTGSETTLAAVVSNTKTHEKYAINDPCLRPKFAVLDPELTVGLPPHITSTTGMDALTHAVEAYIGKSNTKSTRDYAEKAVAIIFANLETAYKDGKNINARGQMLLGSFYGGMAFTRAYVGYVHAVAHNLGGMYGIPHGLANAVILPVML